MDVPDWLKDLGMLGTAVIAMLAVVVAWVERLLKVRELQRRLEQLEHERKQRISRIHLPSDEEVQKYSTRYFQPIEDALVTRPAIEDLARDMRAWAIMPMRHAAEMIDARKIGRLTVEMVRSEFAAIFTALEHLEVIAQTGLASDEQFHKIVAHTTKLLRGMGSEGVTVLDVSIGIPVASRFLSDAESVEPRADLRD